MSNRGCPHNEDFVCFGCETALHDQRHPELVEGCRTCKLRTIQLSPKATPSKRSSAPPTWHQNRNSWERGVARDARGLPLLHANEQPITVKEYAQHRKAYEEGRRRLHAGIT